MAGAVVMPILALTDHQLVWQWQRAIECRPITARSRAPVAGVLVGVVAGVTPGQTPQPCYHCRNAVYDPNLHCQSCNAISHGDKGCPSGDYDELKPSSSSHAPYAVAAISNSQLFGPLSLAVPSWHIDTLTRMSTRELTSLLH